MFHGRLLDFVDIKFVTIKPNQDPLTANEIYAVALHECGHSLGILGHSNDKNDIMYPVARDNSTGTVSLTPRDISTIKLLYRLDADISNFDPGKIPKEISYKNKVILGGADSLLDKKLQEALDYVKTAPNHPISWTSLGLAYYNLKKYNEAVLNYKKALEIDPKYIDARKNLAITYKTMGDTVKAIIEGQNLVQIDPTKIEYSCFLTQLYVQNNRYQEAKNVLNTLIIRNPDAKNNKTVNDMLEKLKSTN